MSVYTMLFIGWLIVMALILLFFYSASGSRTHTPAEHEDDMDEQAAYLAQYKPPRLRWVFAGGTLLAWALIVGILEKVTS